MEKKKSFYERVYEIVAKIPEGYVMTYGQIAEAIGSPRGARIVGCAMSKAPTDRDLPCHRVVNRYGTMAPTFVFGGAEYQEMLLKSEGITFLEDGSIDLINNTYELE